MKHQFNVYVSCLSTERYCVEIEAESEEAARVIIAESFDAGMSGAVKWGEMRDDEVIARELETIERD